MAGTPLSRKSCLVRAVAANSELAAAWYSLGREGGGRLGDQVISKQECFAVALSHNQSHASLYILSCGCKCSVVAVNSQLCKFQL